MRTKSSMPNRKQSAGVGVSPVRYAPLASRRLTHMSSSSPMRSSMYAAECLPTPCTLRPDTLAASMHAHKGIAARTTVHDTVRMQHWSNAEQNACVHHRYPTLPCRCTIHALGQRIHTLAQLDAAVGPVCALNSVAGKFSYACSCHCTHLAVEISQDLAAKVAGDEGPQSKRGHVAEEHLFRRRKDPCRHKQGVVHAKVQIFFECAKQRKRERRPAGGVGDWFCPGSSAAESA